MALVGGLCFCTACGTLVERPTSPARKDITCQTCATINPNKWPKAQISQSNPSAFPYSLRRRTEDKIQELTTTDITVHASIKQSCPECSHPELGFREAQTRGADEGSTIFYHCKNCGHKFNTNN